ncbi:MAG: macro domain-containing protein [Planctomycetes bacterium]|nr:macro domain-containing protein [Planctomycetota bacterium]
MKRNIEMVLGDITNAQADAVVNAANSELILGSGVAGAINRKGGPEIQAECDRIGPIQVGEAVVTGAGNLPCRWVIHAASMRLGGRATAESLRDSLRNSFLRAEEKGAKSVALPAVGAGIAGFPIRRCAEILMNEAALTLKRQAVEKVSFYLFDQVAYDAFRDAYAALGD